MESKQNLTHKVRVPKLTKIYIFSELIFYYLYFDK